MPPSRPLSWALITTLFLPLFLAGCANTPDSDQVRQDPTTTEYCDNYLIYEMCVRDVDHNGDVDLMYFADTREIFMLSPEYKNAEFANFTRHECLQPMDDEMRAASSQLLYIQNDTSLLKKTQLKSRLLLNYTHYLPEISRCMHDSNVADSSDDFGDEDFEEL